MRGRGISFEEAFARYSEAYDRGGYPAAEPIARDILAAVEPTAYDRDPGGQSMRARALYALSQAADARADREEAGRLIERGLAACDAAEALGEWSIPLHRTMLLIGRADQRMARGDAETALADLDLALGVARSPGALAHAARGGDIVTAWAETLINLHHARGWAQSMLSRYPDAETEYQEALSVAMERAPHFVSVALARLALLRRRTGDQEEASGQLRIAEALAEQTPTGHARGEVERNLASFALQTGDLDAAERHLDAAVEALLGDGQQRLAAGAQVGYAELLRLRGRTAEAQERATAAYGIMAALGDDTGRIEALLVLSAAQLEARRPKDAERSLLAAREAAERAGQVSELLRIDLHRAVAAVAAASVAVLPGSQRKALERALDLALPAAIAADAMRNMFPPGRTRERWAREVSGAVAQTALQVLASLGRGDDTVAFLELLSAAVSLDPAADVSGREQGISLAAGSPFAGEYALTAGADAAHAASGMLAEDRVAVAPRVRVRPGGPPALEEAIDEATRRYGFVARSAEIVDAW
jgi:tetratricopeptide (TPR) repeat protein